jgi:superfamily II DNA or RNA helicase
MQIVPRDYQQEALDALAKGRKGQEGLRQLVALPTGAGKTIVGALDIKRVVEQTGKGAIFMAHRDELITQPAKKIPLVWSDATIGRVKAHDNELGRQVTVASVQTVSRSKRLAQLIEAQEYSLLYVDEAHHAVAATYRKVIDTLCAKNPQMVVVGLTATPVRADATKMKEVFNEVTYHKSMLDLIQAGYLSDLMLRQVALDVSIDGVPKRQGDLKTSEIRKILMEEDIMDSMIESWRENAAPRRTIVFAVDVAHATSLARHFNDHGIRATSIYGELDSETRTQRLNDFQAGKYDVIVNCMILCLDSETELLTDRGWTSMNEMSFEHKVANYDAATGEVTFETPLDIVKRPRQDGERMVVLEAPSISVRVTEGHRMLYRNSPDEPWQKKSALELIGETVELPVSIVNDHKKWQNSQSQISTKGYKTRYYKFRVEDGWKEENVWCVRTRTSNLITRRKDGLILATGNTEGYDDEIIGETAPLSCIMLARPTLSQSLYIQSVGRGTRLAPGKDNCLILDFSYNTKRHHIVQLPHLFGLEEAKPREKKENSGFGEKNIPSIVAAVREARDVNINVPPPRVNFRWPKSKHGFCMSIGMYMGYMLIRPTDKDPKAFEIFHIDPAKDGKGYVVHRLSKPLSFDWAFGLAEDAARNMYEARSRRQGEEKTAHLNADADWTLLPPTDKQLSVLSRIGEKPKTRGEANDMITVKTVERIIAERAKRKSGKPDLATSKQLYYLRMNGIEYEEGITKRDASRLIGQNEKEKRRQERQPSLF